MIRSLDFNQAPLLVIWETTRACALACRHCRASAIDQRHPDELTLDEGKAMLDDIAGMGTPIVVFTGGDPLQREDLLELIRYGKDIGLRVGTIPAATSRLTRDKVEALKEAGLDQMALSLDGATAVAHDDFRRVPGSFLRVMRGALWARLAKLPLQINTVFGAWNVDDFEAIAKLVERLEPVFWEVFMLVQTGRGSEMKECSPEQYERLFAKLHDLSRRVPFVIKVTEGPQYRRYVAELEKTHPVPAPKQTGHPGIAFTRGGVNAGKGFVFVDHVGDVFPSGFLPVEAGNVRSLTLSSIYQSSKLFRELRDPALLKGRCGGCEYRDLCGGSRSRAYAATGDPLAEDPSCRWKMTNDEIPKHE